MGFNPLKEKGIPIEKQILNWGEILPQPYDKNEVHPYTRTRVILMNGIEVEGAIFSHQFARHSTDLDLCRTLAMQRRIEQQQQKTINWLPLANESTLEITVVHEQVAVDLTAWLARTEPDPDVKAALDFVLPEDFDHLYRYSNLLEMTENKKAETIVGELTEIFPGRPTEAEHAHPVDTIRKPIDNNRADILTKLHILTIVSGEQQTMNYYMNVGNRPDTTVGRGLYLEIAQIEEQHVSHYESLMDPTASWFEQFLLHEYNECYMYYSCLESETDERIRAIWQRHLEQEVEHLRIAAEQLRKHEHKEAESLLPPELPELTIFQSNKRYVRNILANQVDLTTRDTKYVRVDSLPKDARYLTFQRQVNGDGFVPSDRVIQDHIDKRQRDYRFETKGPHPVERFRQREMVTH